jgi:hypothetical protein
LLEAKPLTRYRYLVLGGGLHLLLVLIVCLRDLFATFAVAPTLLPSSLTSFWSGADTFASAALGQSLKVENPLRNTVTFYLHAAGIEAGYGFFAPNVPSNYKLVFELRYADDRREYELPRIGDAATGFRLESLLERTAELPYEPMRQVMLQMLASPVRRLHPDALSLRAVLGYVVWPSPAEFEHGKKESFEPVYAYDFDLRLPPAGSSMPP